MRNAFAKRSLRASVTALCGLASGLVAAEAFGAELDKETGALVVEDGALKTWRFETDADLASIAVAKWSGGTRRAQLQLGALGDEPAARDGVVTGDDALEGGRAFRVTHARGLALVDRAAFGALATSRFELTLWARADGASPSVSIQYGKDSSVLARQSGVASVVAIRTGRETSDGWSEYTTGPLDGSVLGQPIAGILVVTSSSAAPTASFVVDAIELRRAPGAVVEPKACTVATEATVCGPEADCLYGHCVAASLTWGVLPAAAHRAEIAERWATLAGRLHGNRSASAVGREVLAPRARQLAVEARSSKEFFGGLAELVNRLRDGHTAFGSAPSAATILSPQFSSGTTGVLGACFGIVERDLLGGGLGFGVFHALERSFLGVPLKPGDVVVAIDGQDPEAWASAVIPRYHRFQANDPGSDRAIFAEILSSAITKRANVVTLARCASATSCEGADRQEITIEVASKVWAHLSANGGAWGELPVGYCTPRFRNSVPDFDDYVIDEYQRYNEAITPRTVDGIVHVQFDGFVGHDQWRAKMSSIFEPVPPAVLMDARSGHGGLGPNVEHLLSILRGQDEPIGFLTLANGSWNEPSPRDLVTRLSPCLDARGTLACSFSAWGSFVSQPTVRASATKIAWLNTNDVSANDYMPRLLQGRRGFRIFAPGPTVGAFGAVVSFPSFMPGWSGGSIQFQDSKFAATTAALEGARWESGHGVAPDVVVAQKQSDAILGRDTLVSAARAWLQEN
jgi:hypothetical protein